MLVVSDNRAAEDLAPVLAAFAELTGDIDPESIVTLPTRDVLPFQNLSPHPEIQEERAVALWKIATGAASIVITPVAATSVRLRSRRVLRRPGAGIRRGDTIDTEHLLAHLNTLGYSSVDVVEMPGEYALRGGILDVYPPEADRPLRVEFFGDEVESVRKFDPETQRSSDAVDEAVLLPLTETPVNEEVLGAIHARLSGKRITGTEDIVEKAVRAGGVTVFPGWEFYAPVAGADHTLFDLLPNAAVLVDEPEVLRSELDHTWGRIEEAHERSGIGNLVRPTDIYLSPDDLWERIGESPGIDLENLGVDRADGVETAAVLSQPTQRFHGSVPMMLEEVKKQLPKGGAVLIAVANTGEVERLADMFTEYGLSYRLGSRTRGGESYADETSYFSGEVLTTTIVKAYVPDGVLFPEAGLTMFGARDLFDESEAVDRGRSGTSRRPRHFFLTSVICRWATTLSTSSTGSGSTRG